MQLNYNDGTTPQYNGNISNQYWGTPGSLSKNYTYSYDNLNRLITGTSSEGYTESGITYDVMGNLTALTRQSSSYTYNYTANQLQSVSGLTGTYTYDGNGNVSYDGRTGETVTYNILNLPQSETGSTNLTYTYDATGNKLRKYNGTTTTDYIKGIQYDNGTISYIQTEEGRAIPSGGSYNYEYNLADHLGNVRLSFDSHTGTPTTVQQDDYYPFGLEISRSTTSPKNEYLYNKKELQEETGQYDYGARFYDAVIGRFGTIDTYAEQYVALTPYQYGANNPIKNIDMNGDSIKVNTNININLSFAGLGIGNITLTASVYYIGGNAHYTQGGGAYDGNDAFVGQVGKALSDLSSGANGKDLVDYIEGSTNTTTIVNDIRNMGNMTTPKNGSGILWGPNDRNGGLDQNDSPDRDPFIGLGHELGHVQDIWTGITGGGTWFTIYGADGKPVKDVSNSDKYATYKENQIRAEHGVPLRSYYTDGYNNSRIIDSKGNNKWFRSNPLMPATYIPLVISPLSIPIRPINP